jgi:HK97 family phage major capsid protein
MTLIEKIRARIKEQLDQRAAEAYEIEKIVADVEERGDTSLTEDETSALEEARSKVAAIDETVAGLEADLAGHEADIAAREAAERRAVELDDRTTVKSIAVKEQPTYREGGPVSFFRDLYSATFGVAPDANERLARHTTEMRTLGVETETRDVVSGGFGALVVPQYLTEEYADIARAGRPFLNAVRNLPLPASGMTLNIPRGTTATSVAAQTEGNAVSETDFDETTLAVSVVTHAGLNDVSKQSLDRGTNIDEVIFGDLASAYAASVDAAAITSMAAVSGINAVTYTDADPTVPEFYPKLADAVQQVQSGRFAGPDAIIMHPRRWGWIMSDVDGSNRPLAVPTAGAPQNAVGTQTSVGYGQVVGQMLGLPVITDANIATDQGAGTEDTVYVIRGSDILFWEEPNAPQQAMFESVGSGSLNVRLLLFGYSAFTAGRYPESVAEISGTGLIAPTF